ncbi:hypothetical protein K0651_01385 [Ornithinimicrobium sp. Arc0846-15]|nr:hypothetical protein [Ornithinimicrobium laminariae]
MTSAPDQRRYPRPDLWSYWGRRLLILALLVPVSGLTASGVLSSPGFWTFFALALLALVAWLLWWIPAGVVIEGSRIASCTLARPNPHPRRWTDLSSVVGVSVKDRMDSTSRAVPTLTLWSRPANGEALGWLQRRTCARARKNQIDTRGQHPVDNWVREAGPLAATRISVIALNDESSRNVLEQMQIHAIPVIEEGPPAWAQRGARPGELIYPVSDVPGRVGRAFAWLVMGMASLVLVGALPPLLQAKDWQAAAYLGAGCLLALAFGAWFILALRYRAVLVSDAGAVGYRTPLTFALQRFAVQDIVLVTQFSSTSPIGTQRSVVLWRKGRTSPFGSFLKTGLSEAGMQAIRRARTQHGSLSARSLEAGAISHVGREHLGRVLQEHSLYVRA